MEKSSIDGRRAKKALRAIIVDDSEDDALLIVRELKRQDYDLEYQHVTSLVGLRKALTEDGDWDVILADYSMPLFNGLDALRLAQEIAGDVPFIIVSGRIGEESAATALKAGAQDFISKDNLARLAPAIERETRDAKLRESARKAQQQLRQTEERYRLVIESVQDYAIFLMDPEGKIMSWNSGAEKILGYKTEEILGRHHSIFYPPDEIRRGRPEEEIVTTLATGRCENVGWRVRKGGGFLWGSTILSPVRDESGALHGFTKIIRDITVQKMLDEQLMDTSKRLRELSSHLQTVREEERTRIAREIHDELGQVLTAFKIDLAWLAKRMPKEPPELSERAKGMLELVDSTIQTVRKITTELRPGILDDIGLVAAIEWQAQDFQNRTGIKCDVILPGKPVAMDRHRSTALFRIFQEILTNVAKHSKAAVVDIILTVEDDSLMLEVKDDGRGIREEDMAKAQSFGLVGMRERIGHYGGTIEITGAPNKGTTVTVQMPLAGEPGERNAV